ncbi:hypothetical protein BC835DRAFT_291188 [Cytidiella melzeri]|nr:hypothetical protein BC835DRAFT_291188 [Cytidiella melzeri]
MHSKPDLRNGVLSPPPTYNKLADQAKGIDSVYLSSNSDDDRPPSRFSFYSVETMDDRRLSSESGRATPQPSKTSQNAVHARRYSEASNVLPVEVSYLQSGGSGEDSDGREDCHSTLINAAGLPTPPGTVAHIPSISPPLSHTSSKVASYFTASDRDDPAVLNFFRPHSGEDLSPLSDGSFRIQNLQSTSSHSQSPLVSPGRARARPQSQQLPVPCACTFYDAANGSMALYPPGDADNHTPLYHIRVAPSCFMPNAFITTIERGGTRQLVARFEMGLSRDPPTLFMHNTPYQLTDVFSKFRKIQSKLKQDRWKWVRGQYNLHWNCISEYEAFCHHEYDQDKHPLARLIPAAAAFAPGTIVNPPTGLPVTKLIVYTPDAALLDEIVVSALLVERRRQTPCEGNLNKDLWN